MEIPFPPLTAAEGGLGNPHPKQESVTSDGLESCGGTEMQLLPKKKLSWTENEGKKKFQSLENKQCEQLKNINLWIVKKPHFDISSWLSLVWFFYFFPNSVFWEVKRI